MTALLAVALALVALLLTHEEQTRALAVAQHRAAAVERLVTTDAAWRAGR